MLSSLGEKILSRLLLYSWWCKLKCIMGREREQKITFSFSHCAIRVKVGFPYLPAMSFLTLLKHYFVAIWLAEARNFLHNSRATWKSLFVVCFPDVNWKFSTSWFMHCSEKLFLFLRSSQNECAILGIEPGWRIRMRRGNRFTDCSMRKAHESHLQNRRQIVNRLERLGLLYWKHQEARILIQFQ